MICPNCGRHFSVSETRADYQLYYGLEHPYSDTPYDMIPIRLCLDCAKEYVLESNPMTICRECGGYFNLQETKNNFNFSHNGITYDLEFSEPICSDCAEKHMDALYQSQDDEEQEDIWREIEENPTGEYYHL